MDDVFLANLPDDLLLEVGKIATTFGAIEQAMNNFLLPTHAHLHDYKSPPQIYRNFDARRKAWFRICRDHCEPTSTRGLKRLNIRLGEAANIRALVVHGAWRNVRHDAGPDGWGLYGGKEFLVHYWTWETANPMHQTQLQTDLSGVRKKRVEIEKLCRDFVQFLRDIRPKPKLKA